MLDKLLKIKEREIVSVTGSGGKSSFIKFLSCNLKNKKVLVTTTTKIGLNEFENFDKKIVGAENFPKIEKNGIYLAYQEENEKLNKCIGFEKEFVEKISKNFDVTVIEADGSKKKFLKGWKNFEPVITKNTTKTVGIINLKLIGKTIDDTIIHNISEFLNITNTKIGEKISYNTIFNVIINENGLFKNSMGEKILFINMAETKETILEAGNFIKKYNFLSHKITPYFGSLKKNQFFSMGDLLTYRKATISDCKLIFDWANDDEVRKVSFNSEKIKFEDHEKWFEEKIKSVNTTIFIAMLGDIPIGQIRLEYDGIYGITNNIIDKKYRSLGFGGYFYKNLANLVKEDKNGKIKYLVGNVKYDNEKSQKIYLRMGYSEKKLVNHIEYTIEI